jgi:hypothetical protein
MQAPVENRAVIFVASSTGQGGYNVVVNDCYRKCQCKGFAYRGKCRHVAEVNRMLRTLATVPSEREAS